MSKTLNDLNFRSLLDDFAAARKAFPEDEDLTTMAEIMQLSQGALHYDPQQLPAQVLNRVSRVTPATPIFT
jgi:hypothetical protein